MTGVNTRDRTSGVDGVGARRDPLATRLLVVDEIAFEGGLATFRRHLLPALARQCERLVWVVPDHLTPEYAEMLAREPNASVVGFLWPRGSWQRVLHGLTRRLPARLAGDAQAAGISRGLRQARVRRLSVEGGFSHCLSTAVLEQPWPDTALPTAGVVLDLNPLLEERCQRNILSWVEHADKTLTISEFTRQVLVGHRPERSDRICSVPLAAPPVREAAAPHDAPVFTFYYPSVANEHKGHATLFAASAELVRAGLAFRLVLTGSGTEVFAGLAPARLPNLEEARRLLEANPALRSRVSCLGRQPAERVESEYANCSGVVLPSTYEGFGLPLSEAISRGLPVVCSDIPPFREQVRLYQADDAVAMFSPGDHLALARLMAQMLTRRAPRQSGGDVDRRMALWTWDDVARRYVECLHQS
jgi:glycosyltransferase involved in cell wall biosynthesis